MHKCMQNNITYVYPHGKVNFNIWHMSFQDFFLGIHLCSYSLPSAQTGPSKEKAEPTQ